MRTADARQVTKADNGTLQSQVRLLALSIGLRPAARAMGLSEDRVRNWSRRFKWGLSALGISAVPSSAATPADTSAIEVAERVVRHYGDRAKIGATIAGAKALEHLADSTGAELVKPANAISGDQWTKAVDRAAGWTQARQQGVNVGVQVNITPPSEAERAERRAVHATLDAIARRLSAPASESEP